MKNAATFPLSSTLEALEKSARTQNDINEIKHLLEVISSMTKQASETVSPSNKDAMADGEQNLERTINDVLNVWNLTYLRHQKINTPMLAICMRPISN